MVEIKPPKIALISPETLKIAEEAAEANAKRNAELEAMSPADRERAIEAWAKRLAADVAHLDD